MSLQVIANFSVIEESDDWIVVDKPAPLIVHPANRKPEPTLLGGLEKLLAFEIENGATLGIATRLDRDTSGLVLVAKHTAAAREIGGIFERREAEKEYTAIVRGWPSENQWSNDRPILRAGEKGASAIWVRQIVDPDGRPCRTRFEVESRFERDDGKFACVRCFPETGRMHQIRVHLADDGHPIVGDKLYAGDGEEYLEWMKTGWTPELEKRLILPRHALHATRLSIPWRGRWIEWHCPPGRDLTAFLEGRPAEPMAGIVIWSRWD